MSKIKYVIALCGALVGGSAALSTSATAAPMADPFLGGAAQSTTAPAIEQARIVCNAWGRCWRTRPRYYAPRFYYGRPMYRRHYHRRYYRRW